MNTTVLKKLKVTHHAYERYIERVLQGRVGKGTVETANKWFKEALTTGEKLEIPDDRGSTHYAYQGHTVVYERKSNRIITVKPYQPYFDEDSGYHDIKDEMSAIISKKLMKNLKTLRYQYRQLMIAVHTEEIKRLSVYNPNTQDTIARKVFKLQEKVVLVENKIRSVELVAEQYGIQL